MPPRSNRVRDAPLRELRGIIRSEFASRGCGALSRTTRYCVNTAVPVLRLPGSLDQNGVQLSSQSDAGALPNTRMYFFPAVRNWGVASIAAMHTLESEMSSFV